MNFGLRRRGFQTARFLECHFEQGSMPLDDGILPRRFKVSHHRQDTPGLAQVLKVGTKFCTPVHDQNFHSVIVFEPELSQCGKGLGRCHALPACALVVTCPMTDDVRYSDWVLSIQWTPNFHRVDATNLIETVTFRHGCCRPSSRHRSCFTLWTYEKTFLPILQLPVGSDHFARRD